MSRVKSEEKREAILDAAVALFAGHGYRRTSIEDVARAADVAKGTVYLYYSSKEALFAAVCGRVTQTFLAAARAATTRDGSLEERVFSILAAKFTYLFELVHSSPHAEEIVRSKNRIAAEVVAKADRQFQRLLANTLATAIERGELTLHGSGYTASSAADLLIRCSHGNGSWPSPAPASVTVYDRRLAGMVKVVLAGLRALR